MKWIYAFATIALFATSAFAYDVEEEAGDPRLGFISVDSDGTTSLTFNATSIQNAVILGLFLAVLGALIAPLFLGSGEATADTGYGYTQESSGYEEPAAGYAGYAKRSLLDNLNPVMAALAGGYKKYEEEEY